MDNFIGHALQPHILPLTKRESSCRTFISDTQILPVAEFLLSRSGKWSRECSMLVGLGDQSSSGSFATRWAVGPCDLLMATGQHHRPWADYMDQLQHRHPLKTNGWLVLMTGFGGGQGASIMKLGWWKQLPGSIWACFRAWGLSLVPHRLS